MFSLASGAYQAYMAQQQVNVLIVGASSVGKTTLLERIKVTQFRKQGVVVVDEEDEDSPFLQAAMDTSNNEEEEEEEVDELSQAVLSPHPPSSLPGRIIVSRRRAVETPVKKNSKNESNGNTSNTSTITTTNNKKGFWVCPSPPKYQNAVTDSDDEEEEERLLHSSQDDPATNNNRPLETIDIHNRAISTTPSTALPPLPSTTSTRTTTTPQQQQQYDLKPNTRMLPFIKIRPTIGMNLGQFKNIYGAKCHVWDVGGRLHELWERYYEDCDAVIFVYKWEEEDDEVDNHTNNNHSGDDDDRPPRPTRQEQKLLLQTVRQHVSQDIPFLIFLHSWQSPLYEQLYQQSPPKIYRSCEPLLPSLPLQALGVGNAGTGQGVRAAMEWLLPLAKQQQRIRDRESAVMLS